MYFKLFYILLFGTTSLGALNVTFELVDKNDPLIHHAFDIGDYGDLDFDTERKYVFLCHGWLGSTEMKWYGNASVEFAKLGDTNVILVGYTKALSDPLYFGAAANVPAVGRVVGRLLVNLNQTKNIPLKNMHLLGHSLGAHVAGIAGEIIKEATKKTVGRITGMDPAFPGFYAPLTPYLPKNRISKDDADHVEIIHTSILGIAIEIGHEDFYPNNGLKQPGCTDPGCDHEMSFVYFVLSIVDFKFEGTSCSSYRRYKRGLCQNNKKTLMGNPLQSNEMGKYYLDTNKSLIEYHTSIADPFIGLYINNLITKLGIKPRN